MVKLTSTIYLRFMEVECRLSVALEFSVLSNVKMLSLPPRSIVFIKIDDKYLQPILKPLLTFTKV